MTEATRIDIGPDARLPAVRTIGFRDIRESLVAGFADFKANRSDIFFLAIIYPLVALFAARLAFGYDVLPLVFPILAGMTLLGPVMTIGFDNASRRRHAGAEREPARLRDHPRRGALLAFGGLLTTIFLLWLCTAWVIYAVTMGPETPDSIGAFLNELLTTAGGWQLIVIGNLVGLAFAAIVLAISLVTFPLILDRHVGADTAMRVSVKAAAANPGAVALWGLVVAGAVALGSIPLFIGLAVAMPVLGHATWHLYRRLVAE